MQTSTGSAASQIKPWVVRLDFFHASTTELAPGTVLEHRFSLVEQRLNRYEVLEAAYLDGGGMLKAVALAETARARGDLYQIQVAVREMVLEHVRRFKFPHLPSRQSCIFGSPSHADALLFRDTVNKDRQYLYACAVEDNEPPFIGDLRRIPVFWVFGHILQVNTMGQFAQEYWSGDQAPNPILEVLAKPGSVKVTARADW